MTAVMWLAAVGLTLAAAGGGLLGDGGRQRAGRVDAGGASAQDHVGDPMRGAASTERGTRATLPPGSWALISVSTPVKGPG